MKIQNILPRINSFYSYNKSTPFCKNQRDRDTFFISSKKNITFGNSPIYNFGEVIAGKLCRGAMPETEAAKTFLREKNIGKIIDLTSSVTPELQLEGIYNRSWLQGGKLEKIAQAIDEAIKNGQQVYIHCQVGETRTGIAVAYYQLTRMKEMSEEAVKQHFLKHNKKEEGLIHAFIERYLYYSKTT